MPDPYHIDLMAPLPAPAMRTRLAKMVALMTSSGHSVSFYGWDRVRGEASTAATPGITEKTILRGGGYGSTRTRAYYPIWMICVFWSVLLMGRRRTIFCLGWETAFPAVLASLLTRSDIIFDDADRFSLVVGLPGPIKRLVQRLEYWTSLKVKLHIIPGWSRYEWRGDNMILLRNTPSQIDLEAAHQLAPARQDYELVLYANGWLGATRGAGVFLATLDALIARNVSVLMHIAGRVDCPAGEALIARPEVQYHGSVSQKEALALYPASDVVLTYYDPRIAINRLAESNKWGDCIYFGVPFVVNSEVETARPYLEAGAALSCPYDDSEGLATLLTEFASSQSAREKARTAVTAFLPDHPLFDTQVSNILTIAKEVS